MSERVIQRGVESQLGELHWRSQGIPTPLVFFGEILLTPASHVIEQGRPFGRLGAYLLYICQRVE
jgi:hypothetical protein